VLQMATHDQQNPGGATAMIPVAERPWASRRAFRSCVAAIILSATLMSQAAATPHNGSGQETTTPPKIHELLTLLAEPKIHGLLSLLADPKVQEWLKEQGEAKAVAGSAQETESSVEDYLHTRAGAIRDQNLPVSCYGSFLTRRWREMDSNPRSPLVSAQI
jgi:hypothetical protein